MAWTNGDVEISSSARNAGSRLVRGEGVCSAHGSPYATLGYDRTERCCPWTRTVQGFADLVGRHDCGRRCLGEEGPGPRLGRHCSGRRSPLVERSWLRGRKPISVGESRAALKVAFPVASVVVPWKA